MPNRQSTFVIIAASLILIAPAKLPAADYAYALAEAVDRHQSNAPDAELELGIVDELAGLSELGGDAAWLPDFWAAYFLTQITRSHAEDRSARLERAQVHLDRAVKRGANDPTAPVAEMHALQALLYEFQVRNAPDEENKARIRELAAAEFKRAFKLAPQSPVLIVHAGTDLITKGQSERSWPTLMGGLALLRQAEEQFAVTSGPKGLTTHYNREWINPWADWVYRMYEGGFDAE